MLFLCFLFMFSIWLIVKEFSFNSSVIGTLKNEDVTIVVNKNFQYKKYEVYSYSNSVNVTKTCVLLRPTNYYSYDNAKNSLSPVVLNVQRKIWTSYFNEANCVDISLYYYNLYFTIFIIICNIFVFLLLLSIK